MSERVAVIGSSTWPTPNDIVSLIDHLPAGVVVVTDDRPVIGGIVRDAAGRRGLVVKAHAPNRARDKDAAPFRLSEAIVADCDRLVAFAAHDPGTKRISEGTALRIRLAEKRGIPVEVIETPVPGRVCALITRLRHRYDGIRSSPTPSHQEYRVRSAKTLLDDLTKIRDEFYVRLGDGWDEIDAATNDDEKDAMTDAWCTVLLPTYETVCDVVEEASAFLDRMSVPTRPLHRHSLHRPIGTEPVSCVA